MTRDQAPADRLAELLERVERTGRRASFADLREMARLYRLCSARLAILRSVRAGDPEELRYLNALCVRAYSHMRIEPQRQTRFGRFLMTDFPATLAATARLQLLSALLMVAGALIAVALLAGNPAALYSCIPAGMYPPTALERLADSPQARADFLAHRSLAFGFKSIFSAGLFVHNVEVGLTAFATGILIGAPTVLLVFYNGLTLGAFAWIFAGATSAAFWAWILPHGVPELLAVNLCATGGLLLGRAVIAPGRDGPAAALRAAARPALELVIGALPLFALAATIESFIRQSMLSSLARYAIAGAAALSIGAYIWYVWSLGRRRPELRLDWLFRAERLGASPGSDSTPAR